MGSKIKHTPKKRKSDFQQQSQQENALPEALEYHDDFVDVANKALEKTISYKYWVVGGIAVALAIAIISSVITNSNKTSLAARSIAFSMGQSDYQKPVAGVDAPAGELTESFANDTEKYQSVVKKLDNFLANHKGSSLAPAAHLYKGNAFFQLSKMEDAKKEYKLFVENTQNSDLRDLVQLRIALILKKENKSKDASKLLQVLGKSQNFYVQTAALYSLGELYEQQKNNDDAQKTFKQVVKLTNENKNATSPYGSKAKLKVVN